MASSETATDRAPEDVTEVPADMRAQVLPRRGEGGGGRADRAGAAGQAGRADLPDRAEEADGADHAGRADRADQADQADGSDQAGREPHPVAPRAAKDLTAWLRKQAAVIEACLSDPDSEPGLVKEYRSTQGDLASATPVAAAVAGALALSQHTPSFRAPALIDAWVGERGIAFAAAATLELFGIAVATSFDGVRATGPQVHFRTTDWPEPHAADPRFQLAMKLRHHLAAASPTHYAEVHGLLDAYRSAHPAPHPDATRQRLLTDFLMPEQTDWLDADLAAFPIDYRDQIAPCLAVCAATTPEHIAALLATRHLSTRSLVYTRDVLWTALDSAGAAILPVVTAQLDDYSEGDAVQHLVSVLACIATDNAFQYLVDNIERRHFTPAATQAAQRFPRRAVRILAEAALRDASRGLAAANLLRLHVLAHPDAAREELPGLSPAARDVVESHLVGAVRVPAVDLAALPGIFVDPPWLSDRAPAEPVVIKGLTAPAGAEMIWRDGEREDWASRPVEELPDGTEGHWESIADDIVRTGNGGWYASGQFAVNAPEELVRSVLPLWKPDTWQTDTWAPQLVARFGADALALALHLARSQPATQAHLLAPFAAPEAALLAADWLSRLKSTRTAALAWLTRHPAVATRALIPAALGKVGKTRDAATLALRALAGQGYAEDIAAAAAEYGAAVATAIGAVIEDDGTLSLPKVMPTIPSWAEPSVLPQILLKDRNAALPDEAVARLVLMLAISKPDAPYSGVLAAQEICDAASLAEFAWTLFENWRGAQFPSEDGWAFDALRLLGDDAAVRRLAPMIRLWPGENGHHRAVAGLDVLAAIGGDVALAELYGISQKAKFKGLKERAAQRVTDIADELGLTADQLGDRLVPDLGLDASGTLVLDYGPRQFVVGFDETLQPCITDQAGKRVKALPKPGAKDDDELAPAAYQRFAALKKEVRTLAADQIARFELSMVTQRRWTRQEFTEFFVAHPVLRHVVRRLVWATYGADGLEDAFRVAEDGTFSDVSDNEYKISDQALIGIAHPLHLGGSVPAWSDVFADYELLQPFPQLGRAVHTLTEEERASDDLARFVGRAVPIGKVLGLERRGWRRGVPQDAGIQSWISRRLPDGGSVTVALDPGIAVGHVGDFGETQTFEGVFISKYPDGEERRSGKDYPAFSRLDAITASELLRDLSEVTAGA